MNSNVGNVDRALRIVLGLILAAIGIFAVDSTLWTVALILVGLVLFVTGLRRFCLLYIPLKLNTEKGNRENPA